MSVAAEEPVNAEHDEGDFAEKMSKNLQKMRGASEMVVDGEEQKEWLASTKR